MDTLIGKGANHHVASGEQWQMGKPVASIHFVYAAETFMGLCGCDEKLKLLQRAVMSIKKGELVFSQWLTPEDYIRKHQESAPTTAY